jgi:hypothetical protein
MRRLWWLGAFLMPITIMAAACTAFKPAGNTSDDADAAPLNEGGTGTPDGDDTFDGNVPSYVDAAFDSGCPVLAIDGFEDSDASILKWRFLGSAKIAKANASNNEVELVPNTAERAGAIWLDLPVVVGSGDLHVRFTSNIQEKDNNEADGLTFSWATSIGEPPALGGGGNSWGVCGGAKEGAGLLLDSFNEKVALLQIGPQDCTRAANGQPPTATPGIVLKTKLIDVRVRAYDVIASVGTREFTFPTEWKKNITAIGFTAGTGPSFTRHAIDNVRIDLCPAMAK